MLSFGGIVNILYVILFCGFIYVLAYILYGRFLAKKIFHLDDSRTTPAVKINDDVDYVPAKKSYLLGQHFASIAAAGPITGPIIAAGMFGWFPALLWCVFGTIFIGGVHDMGSLIASVRHKAKSITEVIRQNVSKRAWVLFMLFIWITLVYLIIAFTDITAGSLVGFHKLEDGTKVAGGGIATASILYIFLAIIMGFLVYFFKVKEKYFLLVLVPMMIVITWLGQKIPVSLELLFGTDLMLQQHVWSVIILVYCFLASLLPMWILLQPRGSIGGYFMYGMLVVAAIGLIFGGFEIKYDAFITPLSDGSGNPGGSPLFPILFITIACGACSGFHAIVCSGTTSKQLTLESHSTPVGYGGMLFEGLLACVSVACIMMFATTAPEVWNGKSQVSPNFIYAQGMGRFLNLVGVPLALAISFGLMAFTTFVSDTLDICVRLGRYVVEELTGIKGIFGALLGSFVTAFVPVFFIFQTMEDGSGNTIPAWRIFWNLFGSANQLLAALSLIGISIWLKNEYKKSYGWILTFIPAIFMYVMTIWSLLLIIHNGWILKQGHQMLPYISSFLIILALMVGFETFLSMYSKKKDILENLAPSNTA